jgi:prepilin-type N-terminal cleavage/methylation domain-containing protein
MIKNKKNKGFTLFELLVSISIIGILTALASVAFSGAQKKARDARRMEDIKLVQIAAEQYYSQNNYSYPSNDTTPWSGSDQNILDVFPKDPKTDVNYTYAYTLATNTYCVCALVESSNNANSGASCNFAAVTKTYFCTKNQQ